MQKFVIGLNHAVNGIAISWKSGRNFRIQSVLGGFAVCLSFAFHVQVWEWCIVLLLIGGVLALETINSSIENLCDLISMERNPRIKTVKDLSAGAVLICSLIAFVIGCFIFIPKIISLVN